MALKLVVMTVSATAGLLIVCMFWPRPCSKCGAWWGMRLPEPAAPHRLVCTPCFFNA